VTEQPASVRGGATVATAAVQRPAILPYSASQWLAAGWLQWLCASEAGYWLLASGATGYWLVVCHAPPRGYLMSAPSPPGRGEA